MPIIQDSKYVWSNNNDNSEIAVTIVVALDFQLLLPCFLTLMPHHVYLQLTVCSCIIFTKFTFIWTNI